MSDPAPFNASDLMAHIPHGAFIMTAGHDGRRAGTLVRWAQPCSLEPPLIMLAVPKGQVVEPLIRDSRCFALCQVCHGDRLLLRKFAPDPPATPGRNGSTSTGGERSVDRHDDPFACLPTRSSPNGSPVIERAQCYFDCDVSRQVEIDGDHRLYVGLVTFGERLQEQPPAIFHADSDSSDAP